MIRGQRFTDPQGRVLQYVEAWSPDGLAGPARRTPRRIRYTFIDVANGQRVHLWGADAATVQPCERPDAS
jgi:hypothetical protein